MATRSSTTNRAPAALRIQGTGVEFALDRREPYFYVGQGDVCDVRIRDACVSQLHCVLRWDGGRLLVIDQGSSNGTWINGVNVLKAYLGAGHTLTVGRTKLVAIPRSGVPIPTSEADTPTKTAQRNRGGW